MRLARRRSQLIRAWTKDREGQPGRPYDVDRDPKGYNWNMLAARLRQSPPDQSHGRRIRPRLRGRRVVRPCSKHYVEHERGWPLLYDDDTAKPKREESVQLLFKGIVQHYCLANGVQVDREVYLGKGPVDFAFTKSAFERVLLGDQEDDEHRLLGRA